MTEGRNIDRVAVLMGGPSAEREVSLRSGSAIADALETKGYNVIRVDVTGNQLDLPENVDAVFIALHGMFGEDGEVQTILERAGIPFTGSGSESSVMAFDKLASKQCFESHGIPTPPYEVIDRDHRRSLHVPLVVKPSRQGSSIGITIVMDEADWDAAFSEAQACDDTVLVESYIPGRELTVGIVGESVFPVVEIRAPSGNYNYHAKYTHGTTEYLVPAPLDPAEARLCSETALKAYHALGCRGMGRVDIRLSDDGIPYVLEINTIPGFTETSLLPKAAAAAGIPFAGLCEMVLDLAVC